LRKKAKELLKEGNKLSNDAHVNEGKFVLNIDVLFALQLLQKLIVACNEKDSI
jgi:hypothetical protein